jgi:hypothetical protein
VVILAAAGMEDTLKTRGDTQATWHFSLIIESHPRAIFGH